MRIQDCKDELHNLLLEDVRQIGYPPIPEVHALQEVVRRVASCSGK